MACRGCGSWQDTREVGPRDPAAGVQVPGSGQQGEGGPSRVVSGGVSRAPLPHSLLCPCVGRKGKDLDPRPATSGMTLRPNYPVWVWGHIGGADSMYWGQCPDSELVLEVGRERGWPRQSLNSFRCAVTTHLTVRS